MAEAEEAVVNTDVDTETPDVDTKVDEDGTSFIDFESFDPTVKKRFDRIYGHMKSNERANQEMGRVNRELIDRLTRLENSDIQGKSGGAIARLNQAKLAALDEGDNAQVIDIDNKIRAIEQQSNQNVKPIQAPDLPATDPVTDELMASWTAETIEDGSLKRPWANPGHPYHKKAASIGAAAMEDPSLGGMEDVLAEIDKLMGLETEATKADRPAAGVLPANNGGTRSSKKGKTSLSTDEKNISHVMYPELSGAAAEKQYLKAQVDLGLK